jgi:hypothetical protein
MGDDDRARAETRTHGRRTAVAATAFGLSSPAWGGPVWDALSGVSRPLTDALPKDVPPRHGREPDAGE